MRRKTKYTILDNMDEQERVELRPKFSELLHLNLLVFSVLPDLSHLVSLVPNDSDRVGTQER